MPTKCLEQFRRTKTTRRPCHLVGLIGPRTSSRCSPSGSRTDTSRKPYRAYAGSPASWIPDKAPDLKQPWQSVDIARDDLTTAGIQKFVADYRSTIRR
jgi:hypothetical protein